MVTTSWPPKRILLATDLSARCDRAMDRASSLAALWKAELVAVHALEASQQSLLGATDTRPSWHRTDDPQMLAEQRVRADILESAADVAVVVETGAPDDVILRTAEARGCDFIVTGVARDELLGRLILGSTVDRLLRRSYVPVLVVRGRGRRPYHHIAVATDFSEWSRYALEATVRMFPQEILSIFHAYDAPMAGMVNDPAAHRQQFRDKAALDCNVFLKTADLSSWKGKQPPEVVLEHGEPDHLLYDYVREKDVDLVVLGTLGHGALFEALIGSVAKRLVATLPCDALVVRMPPGEAVAG